MRIHWLQHVPFEGLGTIAEWAVRNGHSLQATRLWAKELLPDPEEVQMLIIMGGPMGVHDVEVYPWLIAEKGFINSVIANGCTVLGICLGAQLLAEQLGGGVYANQEKEIGWFPIRAADGLPSQPPLNFPEQMTVFHWHGDTFDIPAGGVQLARSAGCENQAFAVDDRIIGLQFHLEMNGASLVELVDNCRDELQPGRWIQEEPEILNNTNHMGSCQALMEMILDALSKQQ